MSNTTLADGTITIDAKTTANPHDEHIRAYTRLARVHAGEDLDALDSPGVRIVVTPAGGHQ
ncbi:MAG TPA: hypothetical protein VFM54_05275 [Micromonosporaceae bacterium]|nr:hypothetical protein [Micromonosporaceae bacterium]